MNSWRFIDELQMEAVRVAQTCRLRGVSRAGFYEAKRRAAKPTFCKASGMFVPRSWVAARAMAAAGWPRHLHRTDSKHGLPVAPNVLARQFNPTAPNLAYASDITYIRTGAGWLYLAVVRDLFAPKVVGWAMAPSMLADLVCDALRMAIQQCRTAAGLIVHSEAKMDVADYIVGFYYCERLHSVLSNLPPSTYERKMAANSPSVVSEIT